ncbi:UvrD-helicase domain-containing protein [uncultured Cytophaga sp.]|uniref:UvrD-helicase domain-containing protein n=1 Tax=uncultured Cytophaga sp. TaxID=160238 RepID=UPI0026385C97|nr:UvrD-helicase domain-containing protein [uncultured Cytophaga sp.]
MQLSNEQLAIINSTGDIKINAVAGSGKTTTVIEYAKARPANSKILYLAFNKSVKIEAQKKFSDAGLHNVKVETAHSLAYREVVYRHNYRVKANGYKTHEIVDILGLQNTGDKHAEYIAANHINKFVAYFCNSDKLKVQDLNYREVVFDQEAKAFVSAAYAYIEKQTRQFLAKMDKGEIEITHDFYLKKFQLSQPRLYFDYILFDEGQDASPAMLDVFFKQPATKVIVGDTHQQIYGWRFAVNSLEKANFKTFNLSSSFRFSADIAKLAVDVLNWKNFVSEEKVYSIEGKGTGKENKVKAIIARTNLGLLLKAIEFVIEKKNVKHIYFEGNIHSYTYADEGTSLYDVLNLYNRKPALIRDKLIAQMKSIEELEEYVEKTEDVQLKMMIEIVEEYGNDIPGILNQIKEKHVGNDEKHKAEMIFSTVHRCKGMEYDSIQIVNDFITQDKIEKQTKGTRTDDEINISKLNEEINLLYVAVTRTKNTIHIPETLMPKNATPSAQINVLRVLEEEEERKAAQSTASSKGKNKNQPKSYGYPKEKSYSVDEARDKNKEGYQPWTHALDQELARMYLDGISLGDMAKHFGRTRGAIGSRIKKLELEYINR